VNPTPDEKTHGDRIVSVVAEFPSAIPLLFGVEKRPIGFVESTGSMLLVVTLCDASHRITLLPTWTFPEVPTPPPETTSVPVVVLVLGTLPFI
jgi:hypothetical protein